MGIQISTKQQWFSDLSNELDVTSQQVVYVRVEPRRAAAISRLLETLGEARHQRQVEVITSIGPVLRKAELSVEFGVGHEVEEIRMYRPVAGQLGPSALGSTLLP